MIPSHPDRSGTFAIGRLLLEGLLVGAAITATTLLGLLHVVPIANAPWFAMLAIVAPLAGGLVAGFRDPGRRTSAIASGAVIGFALGVVPASLGIALEGIGLLGSDAEWLLFVAALVVTPTAVVAGAVGALFGHATRGLCS